MVFSRIRRQLSPYLPSLVRVGLILVSATAFILLTRLAIIGLGKLKGLALAPRTAWSLIAAPSTILKTSSDRTNLLILGKGGAGHEAPDLTDTLIFISYHHPSSRTVMISLPRDMWIDSLKTKLNSVYYYGNLKQPGGGAILAKASVEEILGQPVHYIAVIDFNGFTKIVDALGGIDIEVLKTFDDYKYPIPGKENIQPESDRYQHLRFDKGLTHMNGDTLLKFIRSRHSEDPEGTDYARSNRQQQAILALQSRLLSTQTIFSPTKIFELIRITTGSIETDIVDGSIPAFAKLMTVFDSNKLTIGVLDQGDKNTSRQGLLINPPQNKYNQWVLTGRNGTWDQVQQYVSDLLK